MWNFSLTLEFPTETLSLQHQVQAFAPFVLQQYAADAIETMQSDVTVVVNLVYVSDDEVCRDEGFGKLGKLGILGILGIGKLNRFNFAKQAFLFDT